MMYFLDFDRTLFNTGKFAEHLFARQDLSASEADPQAALAAIVEEIIEKGDIAFAPRELASFVYPDVPEFLRMAGNEAVLVTVGDSTLQRIKIENALAGIPRVSVLYTGDTPKGEFLRERIAAYGARTIFVDDMPFQLASMVEHCPHTALFEMRRDGLAGDGRWPVIHSLSELPQF